MEIATKTFNISKTDTINIYAIGDVHEGNVNHAEKEFKESVNIIKNDKNGYWIGMGDYVDAILHTDRKRFNPVTIDEKYRIKDLKNLPKKQIRNFYDKIKPIQDKCLGLLIGNHEESIVKYYQNDIYDNLVNLFDNPPEKLGYTAFLKLGFKFGTPQRERAHTTVLFALNHGDGGSGFREGYPINKVHDVFRWSDADVNLMGHVHQLNFDDKKIISLDQNNNLKKRYKYWGITGCYLYTYKEGTTNYFEHKGRAESDIGMLKVSISFKDAKPFITMSTIKLG